MRRGLVRTSAMFGRPLTSRWRPPQRHDGGSVRDFADCGPERLGPRRNCRVHEQGDVDGGCIRDVRHRHGGVRGIRSCNCCHGQARRSNGQSQTCRGRGSEHRGGSRRPSRATSASTWLPEPEWGRAPPCCSARTSADDHGGASLMPNWPLMLMWSTRDPGPLWTATRT